MKDETLLVVFKICISKRCAAQSQLSTYPSNHTTQHCPYRLPSRSECCKTRTRAHILMGFDILRVGQFQSAFTYARLHAQCKGEDLGANVMAEIALLKADKHTMKSAFLRFERSISRRNRGPFRNNRNKYAASGQHPCSVFYYTEAINSTVVVTGFRRFHPAVKKIDRIPRRLARSMSYMNTTPFTAYSSPPPKGVRSFRASERRRLALAVSDCSDTFALDSAMLLCQGHSPMDRPLLLQPSRNFKSQLIMAQYTMPDLSGTSPPPSLSSASFRPLFAM